VAPFEFRVVPFDYSVAKMRSAAYREAIADNGSGQASVAESSVMLPPEKGSRRAQISYLYRWF
jgi:hypothetical protein